jgi:hypothetical protein
MRTPQFLATNVFDFEGNPVSCGGVEGERRCARRASAEPGTSASDSRWENRMKKSLGLNLYSLTTLLFTMTGTAQETLRDPKPEARVGIVEQPCAPALTLPPSARELLVELFIEPRKLTSTDFERLMSNEQFMVFMKETRNCGAGLAGACAATRRRQ